MLKTKNPQNSFIIPLTVVFVFLATILAFNGVLKSSFLNWDDYGLISKNTLIRNTNLDNIFEMLIALNSELRIWQPIPRLSYSLDYHLYEMAPWGYHLTSLLIHGANTCLAFGIFYNLVLLRKPDLTSKPVLCFAGAMVALTFGIHPLRTEPVSWVSSRDELLCAFFFLLALLTYIPYAKNATNIKRYSLLSFAWLFFLFAILSKAMAISLPIVLLLLDVYPFNRIRYLRTFFSCIAEKIPFFALSVFSGVMTLVTRSSTHRPQSILELNIFTSLGESFNSLLFHQQTLGTESIGLSQRAMLSIENIWFYIEKTLWPINLLPHYSIPENLVLPSTSFWLSLFFFFIITGICIRQFKQGNPLWATIWSYYLITIFPVLGIVYSKYRGSTSDRYTYISTLSLYFLIGLAIIWIWENKTNSSRTNPYKIGVFVSSIALVYTLTILTFEQVKIWKNGESFWFYLLETHPNRAFVLSSLGHHYRSEGKAQKAISLYREALQLKPNLHITRNDLAVLYSPDQPKKSEQEFKTILEQVPMYYHAHNNLGTLYMNQGKTELAKQSFLAALQIQPDYAKSHNNLGLIYMKKKQFKKAEEEFLSALKSRPRLIEAHNNLGMIYMSLGKRKDAERKFEEALRLSPNFEPAFRNLLKLHESGKI
jgi:Tfp pilus assembly protein PilF